MLKIYDDIMGKTNSSFAYKILKENILRLDLKPGEELREIDLFQSLNMSRTPIREALILLKHDGLIETLPQSGTFVTKIDKEKFEDGKMLRICVEEKMIQLACDTFSDEYLKKLEDNFSKQKFILDKTRDYVEFHKLDVEFHQMIFEGVGYKDLFKVTTDNFFDYQRVRVLNSSNKIKDNFIQESHLKILDAIKNKRKDRVHELLNEHFSRLSAKLGYFIEEYPFYFK